MTTVVYMEVCGPSGKYVATGTKREDSDNELPCIGFYCTTLCQRLILATIFQELGKIFMSFFSAICNIIFMFECDSDAFA